MEEGSNDSSSRESFVWVRNVGMRKQRESSKETGENQSGTDNCGEETIAINETDKKDVVSSTVESTPPESASMESPNETVAVGEMQLPKKDESTKENGENVDESGGNEPENDHPGEESIETTSISAEKHDEQDSHVEQTSSDIGPAERTSDLAEDTKATSDEPNVQPPSESQSENQESSAQDGDDDDVIVLEAHIKSVADSGSHPSTDTEKVETRVASTTNTPAPSTGSVEQERTSSTGNESSSHETPATSHIVTTSVVTPFSAIWKAMGNVTVAGPGNVKLAVTKSASGPTSVRIVTSAGIPIQLSCNRQILPKTVGVVNAKIPPIPPASVAIGQPEVGQALHPVATSTNVSDPRILKDIPSHLKKIFDAASALPFKFKMLPKEHGFLTPQQGYRCEECGDAFALKTSLEFHLQRRSTIVECFCAYCREYQVFFNKCTFYGHIRQHCGGVSDLGNSGIRNLTVKPITWQMMELTFEDTAYKRMLDVEEYLKYETGQAVSSIWADDSPKIVGERIINEKRTGPNLSVTPFRPTLRCSECNKQFANSSQLRQHFMYNLPPNQKQFICPTCHAVYFSQCSFKAHSRTHSTSAPFVCPECGVVEWNQEWLTAHVLTHQKNPTVMDAWRCQKCLTFYSTWDALLIHVIAAHCDSYYRCQHCPMAFQSAPSFDQHLRSQHRDTIGTKSTDVQLLMKCCQCEVVYMTRETLLEHLKTHFLRVMPFMVYRCALCGRLMENKSGLIGHFRNVHRLNLSPSDMNPVKIQVGSNPSAISKKPTTTTTTATSTSTSTTTTTTTSTLTSGEIGKRMHSTATAASTSVSCHLCPSSVPPFHNMTSLKMHMRKKHPDDARSSEMMMAKKSKMDDETAAAVTCHCCIRKLPDAKALWAHGQHHLKSGKFVCLLCFNNEFGSAVLLRKHLQEHIELQFVRSAQPKPHGVEYICQGHCGKMFTSTVDALDHLSLLHFLLPLRCSLCNVSFYQDDEFRSHLRYHKNESGIGTTEMEMESSSPINQQKGDDSNKKKINCGKCNETFDDIKSMRTHAAEWHKEAKYYLCLECGLSFVAAASLGRHLVTAHKIGNVEKYLEDNPASGPGKPSELECTVCHSEFSSKTTLDAHVRTHGLLFLKTKARPAM